MKVLLPILIIILVGGFFYFKSSDKNSADKPAETATMPEGDEVSKDMEGNFVFDTDESSAKWTGSKKIIKDYYDSGSIKIQSGNVSFKDGNIESGEIVFDMTSITGEQTSNKSYPISKLDEHLKSSDFFDVEKFPEAKYIVTSSTKTDVGYDLTGDLTLKGKTAPLNVSVGSAMDNGNALLNGVAQVDRSKWDVKYGSESFFDDLGDNVINDVFTLEFKVVARP